MTNIIPITYLSPLIVACGSCWRPMKLHLLANDPAYCDYECGVKGQPAHSKASWERGWSGKA